MLPLYIMNLFSLLDSITEKEKGAAIDDLISDSSPNAPFFFLVILSTVMATLGIIAENASVVIGSMLIAPILSPILSLSLGTVMSDSKLMKWSAVTIIKSTLFALGSAGVATLFFSKGFNVTESNVEIASRIQPEIIYLMIAIVAGAATAYARVKSELNEALPGTAIAVALVPPLAVSGIGIATLNPIIAVGALQMFALNLIGIVVASMVMFSLMNLYPKRGMAERAQEREDRKLEREKAKAEKAKEEDEKKKVKKTKKTTKTTKKK